ncbi:hypothetical protein N7474_009514 [Penicillium riverlandense]|uniref:uncharacterized protein n=1 Tax=Penicillium riverlandense TaxID=1903569 RepID=UPI002548A7C0|nr:uncharacterized protein N7474_009514 [Penicillium riverlandense]KAJ5808245.1 hypothetical protein N7474_009514 [Penicillium riverlandense]
MGLDFVSFYVDWALVEGTPGQYRADGIFALQPFFDAAMQAGIYLTARPGPFINAEVSGGGFPGWVARIPGKLREDDPSYLESITNYLSHVATDIAKAQITEGGPVVLYVPENEYGGSKAYMQYVIDIARNNSIVLPMVNNDGGPAGNFAPGSGVGEVDVYGFDFYPMGINFDFQGGWLDSWGGPGIFNNVELTDSAFARIMYKNNFSFKTALMNLYMTFGGTNWGNLGFPGSYTSYDYAAAISETRNVTRDKYGETKLMANFLKVSPSYLESVPDSNYTMGIYTDTKDVAVTRLSYNTSAYYVIRQSNYSSLSTTTYCWQLSTSTGNLTIPQLDGTLSLIGRDSKMIVTDYSVGEINLVYTTADIFTWKKFGGKTVLVLYGSVGEYHEFAISTSKRARAAVLEGHESDIKSQYINGALVLGMHVSRTRYLVQIGNLLVILLDRVTAYSYWVPQLSTGATSVKYANRATIENSIIVAGGYVVRTASLQGSELHIFADFNRSTTLEVIGVPRQVRSLFINDEAVTHSIGNNGFWSTQVIYKAPDLDIPSLRSLEWKYIDSLPEIQSSYDDSRWVVANHTTTNNTVQPLLTPMSLYSTDYGFSAGSVIYRGYFTATGMERKLALSTQGGDAFGSSVWLNSIYLGSFTGNISFPNYAPSFNSSYSLPKLTAGQVYVFTVVVDNTGLDEDWLMNDGMKLPRGITNYDLGGRTKDAVSWKITGNLGGEQYADLVRGPLNEGAMYAERQGWHQPEPPNRNWISSSPFDGIKKAGIGFYTANFDLDIPSGWDVPMSFVFKNTTSSAYRTQLFVNGYNYGKYVNNIGPQVSFPVPQGILNYKGKNWIALTLWAQELNGASLPDLSLVYETPVITTIDVEPAPQPAYSLRPGAY